MLSNDLASVGAAIFKLILLANTPIDSFDSFPVVASTAARSVESLKLESRHLTFSNYLCFPEEEFFMALLHTAAALLVLASLTRLHVERHPPVSRPTVGSFVFWALASVTGH